MMKIWSHFFDPSKEIIRFRHIWVILQGFTISFWHRSGFQDVGNALGWFLEVDEDCLNAMDKRVGKVLFEIDIYK